MQGAKGGDGGVEEGDCGYGGEIINVYLKLYDKGVRRVEQRLQD